MRCNEVVQSECPADPQQQQEPGKDRRQKLRPVTEEALAVPLSGALNIVVSSGFPAAAPRTMSNGMAPATCPTMGPYRGDAATWPSISAKATAVQPWSCRFFFFLLQRWLPPTDAQTVCLGACCLCASSSWLSLWSLQLAARVQPSHHWPFYMQLVGLALPVRP